MEPVRHRERSLPRTSSDPEGADFLERGDHIQEMLQGAGAVIAHEDDVVRHRHDTSNPLVDEAPRIQDNGVRAIQMVEFVDDEYRHLSEVEPGRESEKRVEPHRDELHRLVRIAGPSRWDSGVHAGPWGARG